MVVCIVMVVFFYCFIMVPFTYGFIKEEQWRLHSNYEDGGPIMGSMFWPVYWIFMGIYWIGKPMHKFGTYLAHKMYNKVSP